MKTIYNKSHKVAVWPGPEGNNGGLAITWLWLLYEVKDSPAKIRDIVESPGYKSRFEALVALFEIDYWKRL
jgi:hypothetical protein